MLVAGLSAIPVDGQQCKPQATPPPKPLLAPKIIGWLKLTNQDYPISQPATLFVPAADGLFRVTAYLATTSARAESVSIQIYWVDKYGDPQSANLNRTDGTIGSVGGVVTIQTKQPVYYSTYFTLSYENTPLPKYDVTATVERLTQ
jgi:hypothetical protein